MEKVQRMKRGEKEVARIGQTKFNNFASPSNLYNCRPFLRDRQNWQNVAKSVNSVEIIISNLDSKLEPAEVRKNLEMKFRSENIPFLQIIIVNPRYYLPSSDALRSETIALGFTKAIVSLPTQQDAQLAIAKLQKTKIGLKRITISYYVDQRTRNYLKQEVVALFEQIPKKRMTLVTFQELFERKYGHRIATGDIHRMKDVIKLQDNDADFKGKIVCYIGNRATASFLRSRSLMPSPMLKPYCSEHHLLGDEHEWAESGLHLELMPVNISLKLLTLRIHRLLDTHRGTLPLYSVVECYEHEFREPFDTSQQPLVPLEHLISCVPGVRITHTSYHGFKRIQWTENGNVGKSPNRGQLAITPKGANKGNHHRNSFEIGGRQQPEVEALNKHVHQISKEIKELLKSSPRCLLPFSKLVPAYHSHFGRQCCVANFGFIKLLDLLESIPHLVQILSDGPKKTLTLTHHEQTKRFASDIIRILRIKYVNKSMSLRELPLAYEEVFQKRFDIADYGVCQVGDILTEVWENTLVINYADNFKDTTVEIPKREQTPKEVEMTKQFAKEVTELLSNFPNFEIAFSKFIPSYHHYFSRQCRVSDYGFAKLIQLFEAISPDIVEICSLSGEEDRVIRLSKQQRVIALGLRFVLILKDQPDQFCELSDFDELYRQEYGCRINYGEYDCHDVIDLVSKMPKGVFNVVETDELKI